jgi:hypothetical protein
MPDRRLLALLAPALLGACTGAGATGAAAGEPACAVAAAPELRVGEIHALSGGEAACFRLSAGEYVLAGFDARDVEAARGGAPLAHAAPRYTVADATTGALRSAAPGGEPARPAPPAAHHRHASASVAAPASPFARARPWTEGERFAVEPLAGGAPVSARVVRVVGGRLVLAVVEGDEAGAGRVLQQAGEALEFLSREGVPLLDALFEVPPPATSAGSGQLLVLAAAWNPDQGAGATWSAPDGGEARSFVWLNLNLRPGYRSGYEMFDHASYRVKVLAHELTHAWQAARGHARHGSAGGAPAWSAEGGADLVAMELVRRFLRIGEGANWRWHEHLHPARPGVVYALEPAATQGRLSHGYYDAASFLRDLHGRLVRGGMDRSAALAELSRGALEGWFGEGCQSGGCPGLAGRMRARLGEGWTPEEAVLLWTVAQAADDRTGSPELANAAYYRAGAPSGGHGWAPAAELRGGTGESAAVSPVSGGSFHLRLHAREGSVFSAGPERPGERWMLVRLR